MATSPRAAPQLFLFTVLCTGLAAASFVAVSLVWMAHNFDLKAREDAKNLVRIAFQAKRDNVATLVKDYAWWQEAYDNVRDDDLGQIYANIGSGATEGSTFDLISIMRFDGRRLYGWRDGKGEASDHTVLPASITAQGLNGVADLPIEPVEAHTGFYRIDGQIAVLGAARITPYDFEGVDTARLPILVAGILLSPDRVAEIGETLLLTDMRLHLDPLAVSEGRDQIVLREGGLSPVARITWASPAPGRANLVRLIPAIVAFGLTVLAGAAATGLVMQRQARQLIAERQRAWSAARADGMTGLLNRTGFAELPEDMDVARELAAGRASLVYIDLNEFKALNDTMGHEAGDVALRTVADRMRRAARKSDLLGRVGGDEFAALFTGADAAEAARGFAGRFAAMCQDPVKLGEDTRRLLASIGIADARAGGQSLDALMLAADVAMYMSKSLRKSEATTYSEELDRETRTRRQIELRLRHHLDRAQWGTSGFALAYQPIIDRRDESLSSVEALLRWTDEELGIVSPVDFIPVAEATALIAPLGRWVLEQVCERMREWPDLKVSVNVSPVQLLDPDFPAIVQEVVKRHRIDPARIVLEITETALIEVPDIARARIDDLRAAGFAFALDDFGTGFASISYLRRFPFSRLKIDRSFVTNMGNDPHADILFQSIVQMGRAFELDVVAEGVEEMAQSQLIRLAQCTLEQGYLHDRPMSFEDLEARYGATAGPQAPRIAAGPGAPRIAAS